uniref:CYTH domain-containing protein n=1 Tax=Anopheles epiroticus TaxID=199890 RepID=A0A182PU09_9DIPT
MYKNGSDLEKHRNVELKARLNGENGYTHRVAIAKQLTGSEGITITQKDVFFNATTGRLKLRYLQDKPSELISYDRTDVAGPKLSIYSKLDVTEPALLEQILSETVGVRGRLNKTRLLFLHEQTRIHLDVVESLGHFLEFEVVLTPDQSLEQGQAIADKMKELFEISDADLMTGAYIDELLK